MYGCWKAFAVSSWSYFYLSSCPCPVPGLWNDPAARLSWKYVTTGHYKLYTRPVRFVGLPLYDVIGECLSLCWENIEPVCQDGRYPVVLHPAICCQTVWWRGAGNGWNWWRRLPHALWRRLGRQLLSMNPPCVPDEPFLMQGFFDRFIPCRWTGFRSGRFRCCLMVFEGTLWLPRPLFQEWERTVAGV